MNITTIVRKEYHILNLGAGIQSSVVFLMRELHFDAAIFADVQEEPEAVYRHLEWLKKERPEVPVYTPTAGRLGSHLKSGVNGKPTSIPAFTQLAEWGRVGKMQRRCTSDYKIKPIEQSIRRDVLGLKPRQRISNGLVVHQYFGISIDEKSRALNIILRTPKWSKSRFPLLDANMSRADCVKWLRDYGMPHDPERSACVFCPFKSNREWLRLKSGNAKGWARAVEIDRVLRTDGARVNRKMKSKMFLHRSCQPLEDIDFEKLVEEDGWQDENQMQFECEGMCGT